MRRPDSSMFMTLKEMAGSSRCTNGNSSRRQTAKRNSSAKLRKIKGAESFKIREPGISRNQKGQSRLKGKQVVSIESDPFGFNDEALEPHRRTDTEQINIRLTSFIFITNIRITLKLYTKHYVVGDIELGTEAVYRIGTRCTGRC